MKLIDFFIFTASILYGTLGSAQTAPKVNHIEEDQVSKIWDQADHNAFTDLIRFKDAFYCTFREASGHVVNPGQENGSIRVIKSPDGKEWTSVALLKKEGLDLRDPKLSITPEGRLMVIMGGSVYREGKLLERIPQVAFSDYFGTSFKDPQNVIIDPDVKNSWDWIWRVTWNDGTGYAIDWQLQNWESGYPTGTLFLLKTLDGVHYEKVSYLEVSGYPNESTIRFDENNQMYVVIRRERGDNGDQTGVLATASSPYKKWDFNKLTELGRLGGPNFIFLDENNLLFGSRGHNAATASFTRLELTDLQGKIKKTLKLPSGGDNSYPGLLIHNGKVWVSYYSSHEGKAAIYLTQVSIKVD